MTVDWTALGERAKRMTSHELVWAMADCAKAAEAAEALERAGNRVSKTGGYYRDEASVYRTELARRGGAR